MTDQNFVFLSNPMPYPSFLFGFNEQVGEGEQCNKLQNNRCYQIYIFGIRLQTF